MLSDADYAAFRGHVESQSVRHVRRFLDYGHRVDQGVGLSELDQWLGRILLDREDVYGPEDRALAFGIGAGEWLARHRSDLQAARPAVVTIAGPVDQVVLIRLLVAEAETERQSGLAQLVTQRYPRLWKWVEKRSALSDRAPGGDDLLFADASFQRFLVELEAVDPLPDSATGEATRAELEAARQREERLHREVAAVTERAERAVSRLEVLQEEVTSLRRQVRETRAHDERLRDERSRRIRGEREARDAVAELERLKKEYVRLDARLREAVQNSAPGAVAALELEQLAQFDRSQLLGLGPDPSPEDLTRVRRRFAAAFHSDRAAQLPSWVGDLFDRLLGIVNAACDRKRT